MRLNFAQFKKVKEEPSATTLQHPDGHTIRIAHGALSAGPRAELKRLPLYEGGEVEPKPTPTEEPVSSESAQAFSKGFSEATGSSGIKQVAQKITGKPKPKPMADGGKVRHYAEGTPNEPIQPAGEDAPTAEDTEALSAEESASREPVGLAENIGQLIGKHGVTPVVQAVKDTADAYGRIGHAAASFGKGVLKGAGVEPEPDVMPTQQVGPMLAANPGAQTVIPQSTQPPESNPMQQSLIDQQAALTQAGEGYQEVAKAQGALGKAEAPLYSANQNELQIINDKASELQKRITQHTDDLAHDIINNKIDTGHYWTSHSKVASAIGLVLGGIGGGLMGQENPAMKFIQNQMDMDLRSQEANLGAKKSVMEGYLHLFGNVNDARNGARIAQLDMLQNQLGEQVAKNADPMAQARAKIALAGINQEKAKLTQQISMSQLLLSSQNGQGPGPDKILQWIRMQDPEKAKELESRYVPGVGIGSIPIDQKSRDEMAIRQELDQKLGKLETFASQHSGSLQPAIRNQGRVLAQDAQDAYRRANGQGVFREAESKFVNNMVDQDPTKFFGSFRTMPGYEAIRQGNRSALASKLQSFGIRPNFASVGPTQPMERPAGNGEYKFSGGRWWTRGPNGKAVPVK